MTDRSVTHASFVLERTYDASPARVFHALTDPHAKSQWFVGPDEWEAGETGLDFRVGGREVNAGGPVGGPVHRYEAEYQDIVDGERLVTTYSMRMDDTLISVSVATFELSPVGDGTRLVLTEMGAYLDGYDDAGQREHGTRELLDALGAYLANETADA